VDKTSILSLANIVENEYSAFLNQVKKLEVFEFPTSACEDFVLKLKSEGEDGLKKIRSIRRKILSPHRLSNNWAIEIHEIKTVRVRLIPKQASSLRLQCSRADDFIRTQFSRSSRLAG